MGFVSCTIEKFVKEYSKKSILCFGSGSYFQILLWELKERNAEIRIEGVVDNNPLKKNMEISFDNIKIPVISMQQACEILKKNPVILITSASHEEMLRQLKELPNYSEIIVYSYFNLKLNSQIMFNQFDQEKRAVTIPKKIHYCWFGKKEIPKHLVNCIDTWKKFCPDYELTQWNENNYDIEKNFYLKTCHKNKKLGFLPDYVRLDVVYQHGGIYLDTDVELIQSLDSLLYHKAFFGTEITGGINEGSGFGAIKGYPFIKDLMKVYEDIKEETPFLFNTCMGKEIEIFHRYGYRNNGLFQEIHNTAFYPFYVLAPKIKETGEQCITEKTIGIHHFDGSWCEKVEKNTLSTFEF